MKGFSKMKKILLLSTFTVLYACSQPEAQTEPATKPVAEKQATDKQSETKPAAEKQTAEKKAYQLDKTDLGQGLYMLVGRGGNIGVLTGSEGVFVIDDQFANLADAVIEEINKLSDGPIRFVANTHYHGDHTGGNEAMRKVGASIVAHDNVRVRMSQDNENKLWNRTTKATDPASWPTITFSESMTFHFNGQTIDVVHTPKAHTDGDAILYFREANVLHMGDNFFNGMFPYIDIDGGGSVAGMIAALDRGLEMSGPKTKIIPGHGPLSSPADMKATRDMLADVQSRVKARVDAGDDLSAILKASVLSDLSHLASFIDEENMIKITYRSLTGRLK